MNLLDTIRISLQEAREALEEQGPQGSQVSFLRGRIAALEELVLIAAQDEERARRLEEYVHEQPPYTLSCRGCGLEAGAFTPQVVAEGATVEGWRVLHVQGRGAGPYCADCAEEEPV